LASAITASSGTVKKEHAMREPQWRQEGEEPDYRFSLANERTFLAWIRTALGLMAGGVVLDQFSTKLGPSFIVVSLAIVFGVLAAMLCMLAYMRWRANEIAMRHSRRLPVTVAIPLIATATFGIAAAIVLLLVVRSA
jgi:putative membrane protein